MPFESVFLRNARRLAQMGLVESKKEKSEMDLKHVTATQAEKILKVPRDRISKVLPVEENTQQERVEHYDISLLVEVLNNTHHLDVDEHYYVLAEYQLGLLQAVNEPTPQQIGRYEMSWASNVFRNPHFLPKFKSADIVKEILRKAFLRAIVWTDDKTIQEGVEFYDLLAYGKMDEDTDTTKCVCLKVALPECPEDFSVQEYRQAIIDRLMVEPESADGGFYILTLCGDGALYRRNCPELVKELEAIWNNEEDLQNWLANIRKEIPGIQDQQIEEQIREGFVDQYPIVKKLTLQQKIAFEGSFGDLDGLATELKRKLDRDYWRNIPNKYNITEPEWRKICVTGLKNVQGQGNQFEWIKLPVCYLPKIFGYRVYFGKNFRLSFGYKDNGNRLNKRELAKLKSRLSNIGILIRTGELVRGDQYGFNARLVDFDNIFHGIQKGEIDEVPKDIVIAKIKFEEHLKRSEENKRIQEERRKENRGKRKLRGSLKKKSKEN